jgi:hypothetical protein
MFRCVSIYSNTGGCVRDQTSDFDRRSRWLSCGHTQEHMWTCDMKRHWVIGDTFLFHASFTFFTPLRAQDVATRSLPRNFLLCRIQKDMNKTGHGDTWTSVRTRQTQPNRPTESCFRVRWNGSEMTVFLTTTHITGVCVRETWMSVPYDLNRSKSWSSRLLQYHTTLLPPSMIFNWWHFCCRNYFNITSN